MKSDPFDKLRAGKLKVVRIGVFDSGIGGRLIADKINKKIPEAEVIFKSDSKYFPYGDKSSGVILKRLVFFTKEFNKLNCGIIVIACNTATTNTIDELRKIFLKQIFVGIEPPVKPIIKLTKTGKVILIATESTIASERFKNLKREFSNGKKVIGVACPGLAEEIENSSNFETDALACLIKKYLDEPLAEGADVVGLGCTHYPHVLPLMKKLYPRVIFYDPAEAVADQVARLIQK